MGKGRHGIKQYIKLQILFAKDNVLGQFLRSAIVGGIASIVDISLFSTIIYLMYVNHIVTNTLTFTIAMILNYFLNSKWVFNIKTSNIKRDFLLFSVIGISGLILSNILMYLMVDTGILLLFVHKEAISSVKPIAKIITVFLVFIWNFVARKKFVFSAIPKNA